MAKEAALKFEDFFSAAVLASPDMIAVSLLGDGTYLQVNDAFLQTSGYERAEVIGKSSTELGLWDEADGRENFRELLTREGKVRDLEVRLRRKTGEIGQFQVSAAIVSLGGRDCVITVSRDISERLRLVEELEKGRCLLERAEEMANIGSWEFDYRSREVRASEGAHRIYGLPRGTFTVESIESIPLPEYRATMNQARDVLIAEGRPYDIEFRIARGGDGAIRDIHSKASWDASKRRLFGIIRDVTEERAATAGLTRALAEKDLLLKELHHRTKNNMQVIISLLDLEASRCADEATRETFGQVQRRIASMALVHEMLYRSKDLSRIALREFIPSLVNLLRSGLGDHEGRVAIVHEVEDLSLYIDAALPCGLILNELVTNALIHAFPGDRGGTIEVLGGLDDRGFLRLEVRDDGIGLGEDFSLEGCSSLGLWLVSNIGQSQLRGSVRFDGNSGGTSCVLTFDLAAFGPRS